MPGENDLWAWLQSMGVSPQQAASSNMFRGGGYGGGQSSINANAQVAANAPQPDALGYSVTAGDDGGFNNPYQAAANAPALAMMPPRTPTPPRFAWPDSSTPTGMPAPQGSPSATPQPADSGPKGPLASPSNTATPMKRRAGAPNLGYYSPNNRFIGIDRPNADPQNSMRAGPQGTALNLAGLFGGGQPAANPDVPAAAAQPMSGITPAAGDVTSQAPADYGPLQQGNNIWDILSKAPWNMGPVQQGNIWKGSGGPHR